MDIKLNFFVAMSVECYVLFHPDFWKHLSIWTSTHNKTGRVLLTKAEVPLASWTDSFQRQVYIKSP